MTQILMHAALIFATIPIISPILKTFNTGFLVPDAGQIDNSRQGTNTNGSNDDPCNEAGANSTKMRSIVSLFGQNGHFNRAKSTSTSETPTSPSATLTSVTNERPDMMELPLTRSRSPLLPLEFKSQGDNNEGWRDQRGGNRNSASLALGSLQPSHFEYETTIESSRVQCRHDAEQMKKLPMGGRKGRKGSPSRCRDTTNGGVGGNQKRSSSCYDDVGDDAEDELNDGNILSVHAGNDRMFIYRTVDVHFYDKEESKGDSNG